MVELQNLSDEAIQVTFKDLMTDRDKHVNFNKKDTNKLNEWCAKLMGRKLESNEDVLQVYDTILTAMDKMLEDISKEMNRRTLSTLNTGPR
jgi:hypothetical protein